MTPKTTRPKVLIEGTVAHAIWNRGVPLSETPTYFATPELKGQLKLISDPSFIEHMEKTTREMSERPTHDSLPSPAAGSPWWILMETLSGALQRCQQEREPREALIQTCRDNAKRYLCEGHLLAYGFDRPRNMDTTPVEIPSKYFSGHFTFSENKLSHHGITINNIRVITPNIRDDIIQRASRHITTTENQKKRGRRNMSGDIEAAYKALSDCGEVNLHGYLGRVDELIHVAV